MKEKIEIKKIITEIKTYDSEIFSMEQVRKDSGVYKEISGKTIGISYLENELDDERGFNLAKNAKRYPYNHMPSLNTQMNVKNIKDDYKFPSILNTIISLLKEEIFSNTDISLGIMRIYYRHNYTNDRFLHLNSESLNYEINLEIGENGEVFHLYYEKFDLELIIYDIKTIYNVLNKPIAKIKPEYILIGSLNTNLYDYFEEILNPKNYEKYKEDYNKKFFSNKLNLYTSLNFQDRKSRKYGYLPFFDWEGSINQMYRKILIENGTMIRPYTDNDMAKELEQENTASAYSNHDNYPAPKLIGAYIMPEIFDNDVLSDNSRVVFIKEADIEYNLSKIVIKTKKCFLLKDMEIVSLYPNFELEYDVREFFTDKFIGSFDVFPLNSMENSIIFKI